MSGMKNLAALTLGALLMLPGLAFAEPAGGAQKDMGPMAQHPDLTPEQQQKVRTIMSEQAEKRRALEQETQQRLSTVLNPEQMKRMEEHGFRHGGRHDRGPGEHMAQELNLTPDQKAAVEKIFSDTRSEHEAMDKSDLGPEKTRAQMDVLHAKTRDKLAKILNAEQLARFDEMHSRYMKHRERSGHRHSKAGDKPDMGADATPESKPD